MFDLIGFIGSFFTVYAIMTRQYVLLPNFIGGGIVVVAFYKIRNALKGAFMLISDFCRWGGTLAYALCTAPQIILKYKFGENIKTWRKKTIK